MEANRIAVERFLALAPSAKGRAAAALCEQVAKDPNCLFFSEILCHENVSSLRGTEHSRSLRLLEILAFGGIQQLQAEFPEVPETVRHKSALLTLMSTLAVCSRPSGRGEPCARVPYDKLLAAGCAADDVSLESLVVEAGVLGLVRARMSQSRRDVNVEYVMGRDVDISAAATVDTGGYISTPAELLASVREMRARVEQARIDAEEAARQAERRISEAKAEAESIKAAKAAADAQAASSSSNPASADAATAATASL